jgi:hypothetical protein
MTKIDNYRQALRSIQDWDPFLLNESGLPGPRGNLELAQAAAAEGDASRFYAWLAYTPERAPYGSPLEFLTFCGTLGLGELLVAGQREVLGELHRLAGDPRWRVREAVAMALQRWGDANLEALLDEMDRWSAALGPNDQACYLQRAAVAALCEPRLLVQPVAARRTLALLDRITASMLEVTDRSGPGFQALKKGLGYGWSVAVAALPEAGKPLFEKWLASPDQDVTWIMRENLKKKRLERMDAEWVVQAREKK